MNGLDAGRGRDLPSRPLGPEQQERRRFLQRTPLYPSAEPPAGDPSYDRIVEEANAAVITIDRSSRITVLNRAAQRLIGVPWEDAVGCHLFGVWSGVPSDPIALAIDATLSDGNARSARACMQQMPSGRRLYLDFYCSALPNRQGEIAGVLIIAHDVTKAVEEAEQGNRLRILTAIGRLARKAAHEIGNPLGAITTCSTSLMSSKARLSGSERELIEIIVDESRRLKKTVTDFLSLSTSRELRMEQLDICRLLDYVVRTLGRDLWIDSGERKIRIQKSYKGAIPAVLGDAARLSEALRNILLNAIEAMPGGGRVQLSVATSRPRDGQGDSVVVSVRDNGVGIPAGDLQCVAMPFFSSKPDRIGLGLTIASEIINTHGGEIAIESEQGKGTCVQVTLPIAS
jgi:PAS domain S-box-containing protein